MCPNIEVSFDSNHQLFDKKMFFSSILLLLPFYFLLTHDSINAAIISKIEASTNGTDVHPPRLVKNSLNLYGLWPDPRRIPYRIATMDYAQTEIDLIQTAMQQVSMELNQCVQFHPFNEVDDANRAYLFIAKHLNDGSPSLTCFSFPGLVIRADVSLGQGQKMLLTNGTHGCLGESSPRDVMKYLVNALGVRNEHNRPDRDLFIQVFPENITPELSGFNLLTTYSSEKVTILSPFDRDSITIPLAEKYAQPGTQIFQIKSGERTPVAHLSLDDCLGISNMYSGLGCDPNACIIQPTTVTVSTIPVATPNPVSTPVTVLPPASTTTSSGSTTVGILEPTDSPSVTSTTQPQTAMTDGVLEPGDSTESATETTTLTTTVVTTEGTTATGTSDLNLPTTTSGTTLPTTLPQDTTQTTSDTTTGQTTQTTTAPEPSTDTTATTTEDTTVIMSPTPDIGFGRKVTGPPVSFGLQNTAINMVLNGDSAVVTVNQTSSPGQRKPHNNPVIYVPYQENHGKINSSTTLLIITILPFLLFGR